jgi:hypothetical protein
MTDLPRQDFLLDMGRAVGDAARIVVNPGVMPERVELSYADLVRQL